MALFSCRKVIHVDLNSAAPKVVIEANISDEPGPYFVKVTKTINFDQSNVFPPVTGAAVVVSDDAGNTETLAETSPGVYQTATLTGTPGRTYTLTVTIAGATYKAVSKMYAPVTIDSIKAQRSIFGAHRNIHVFFTDPGGIDNWYRIVETVNDTPRKDIYITGDILRNGQQLEEILFTDDPEKDSITHGDRVSIALQSVDEGVYDYFRTLSEITQGGDPGATPSNPVSNFGKGALGYFNAHAVTRKEMVVP